MNIDQLITEKTQILRNDQGAIVNGIAVEDVKAAYSAWERQRAGLTTEWLKRGRKIAALESQLNQQNKDEFCNYPECNCPFDKGPDNKCAKGLQNKEQ